MAYATLQDLIDRFGRTELVQLTDRTNKPASTIDESVVARALADAEAEINGYVAKRYQLPLVTVPDALTKKACDIARYYLHGKAADKDSQVYLAYKAAIAWLQDVARGLVIIEAAGIAPDAVGGGAIRANPSGRVFTRQSLRDA
jgi:phage gp36-like protein